MTSSLKIKNMWFCDFCSAKFARSTPKTTVAGYSSRFTYFKQYIFQAEKFPAKMIRLKWYEINEEFFGVISRNPKLGRLFLLVSGFIFKGHLENREFFEWYDSRPLILFNQRILPENFNLEERK